MPHTRNHLLHLPYTHNWRAIVPPYRCPLRVSRVRPPAGGCPIKPAHHIEWRRVFRAGNLYLTGCARALLCSAARNRVGSPTRLPYHATSQPPAVLACDCGLAMLARALSPLNYPPADRASPCGRPTRSPRRICSLRSHRGALRACAPCVKIWIKWLQNATQATQGTHQ